MTVLKPCSFQPKPLLLLKMQWLHKGKHQRLKNFYFNIYLSLTLKTNLNLNFIVKKLFFYSTPCDSYHNAQASSNCVIDIVLFQCIHKITNTSVINASFMKKLFHDFCPVSWHSSCKTLKKLPHGKVYSVQTFEIDSQNVNH